MKVLYLSALASRSAIDEAPRHNPLFSSYAVQKFNRLIVEGLVKNDVDVVALSSFYQVPVNLVWKRSEETESGVKYKYISSPKITVLRHLWIFIYCFFFIVVWGCRKRNDKSLMCDVLNVSACIGGLLAARLIGLRCVGIMTDMPELMVKKTNETKSAIVDNLYTKLSKSYLKYFTHYVFLTEQMCHAVNDNNHPYIIMEGLVEAEIKVSVSKKRGTKKVVLYAGGLHERYGLKTLVDGFIDANVPNTELWLFGNGPFVEDLKNYQDANIKYMGVRPNQEIIVAETEATLLVNPRPTSEEFTKYSFPSKNMEYMASGTPLLTTRLPGMPAEYYPYVYLFKDETTKGFSETLRCILTTPEKELQDKGALAQSWVLRNKNNIAQTRRILSLLNNTLE